MFEPGGASGVLLKPNIPLMYAQVKRFGFILDVGHKLSVISYCYSTQSHSAIEKSGSHVAKPLIK